MPMSPGERDDSVGRWLRMVLPCRRPICWPYYLIRVRRRWIKTTSTMTNNTPATMRIIVVLSILKSPFFEYRLKCPESLPDMGGAYAATFPLRNDDARQRSSRNYSSQAGCDEYMR